MSKSRTQVEQFTARIAAVWEAAVAEEIKLDEGLTAELARFSNADLVEYAMIMGNQFEGNASIRSVCERAVLDAYKNRGRSRNIERARQYSKFLMRP